MKRILDGLDTLLGWVEFWVIAVLSLAALGIGTAQVVLRYAFNTGFHWSETVFIIFTVAGMLVGGSRAVRDDAHVKVDLVPQLLPAAAQRPLRVLRYLISFALVAVFFVAGVQYVGFTRGMGIADPASGIPVWWVFMIVPLTMGAFAIRYLILLAREARGEVTGRTEAEEAADAAASGGTGT